MQANPFVVDAVRRVEQQIQQKQHAIGIRKLADALCFALQIQHGQELVLHLTRDSTARNNRDAVAAWVRAQMTDSSLAITPQTVQILTDLLSRKLQSICEETQCN